MKLFSVVAFVAAWPWLGELVLAQSNVLNPWEVGKDISFAGLVWFLVGYLIPKLMSQHREEREGLVQHLTNAETKNRELLEDLSERHAESAKSGHAAANNLAAEIRSCKEQMEGWGQ
ncbi:MAG: hypothetical protein GY903_31110 [Fuerstiella sp.]|nr:hypothetical protein [Fuerstiella sp.]MCP4858942.1 hypothetical protein [Fuerstiella sp.]